VRRLLALASLLLAACAPRPERAWPAGAIVAIGDSLTAGHYLAPEESWPVRLGALLGRPVVNLGVSGETAEQIRDRIAREGLPPSPSLVLVCAGANDILRGMPEEPMLVALRDLVRRGRETGAPVVVIGLESYRHPQRTFDHGAAFRRLAEENGAGYVPDLTGGVFTDRSLMRDAIHPNGAGNAAIARRLATELQTWLPPARP
jgi:acyl-CoA thioesterase-1